MHSEIVKPAFERITVTNAVVGHMKYVLSLEQKTVSKLLGDGIPVGLDAGNFPMLLPPQPWTSLNSGGYLTRRCASPARLCDARYELNNAQTRSFEA